MKIELTYSESSLLLNLLKKGKSEVEETIKLLESDDISEQNKRGYRVLFENEIELIDSLYKKLDT